MRCLPRAVLAMWLAALAGCAPPSDAPSDPHALPLLGTQTFAPLPKADFTLTDTHGRPFDFREETDGKITLLFFGYTYCPDICPLHMATLAAALDEVDPRVREQVILVFVSVDPERDTPERLGRWLATFDSAFVGVRGTLEEVSEILAFYRYPPPETSGEATGYTVGHPALVYAFAPDNLGRAMYGPETTRAVWAHDLSLLADHDWSGSPGAAPEASRLPPPGTGIAVLDARAPEPRDSAVMAVYLTLQNPGPGVDTLRAVSSPIAARGSVHDMVMEGGATRMVRLPALEIPAGGEVRLEPGNLHIMLEGLNELPQAGENVALVLRFARAGTVPIAVRMVRYDDLVR